MAFRNRLSCYICDRQFVPNVMARIDGDANAHKREIAIARRELHRGPPLEVTPITRICINCNQSILEEIVVVEQDPTVIRLNVLTQTRNNSCIICNGNNANRLSSECKADVFIQRNIFIPETARACEHHLDNRGYFLRPLLNGLRFINRPYVIRGPQLQLFLENLRIVARNQNTFNNENDYTDLEFKTLTSLTKEQFRDLLTHCVEVPCQGGHRYVSRKDLIMFLCKLRQGLSDEFLQLLFQYSTRQAVSLAVATVRQSLMLQFVPNNIGFEAINREDYIREHVTNFSNQLYNPEPHIPRAIAVIDGTYSYIPKSSNFRVLRQSYCRHKGRHLLKPALIVAPDGYILEIQGPYFSDAQNNDAAMLRNEIEDDEEMMNDWFQNNDIVIVDRGYRDVIQLLQNIGINSRMPALLEAGERQLSTEDANASRLVTCNRWVVEARNGHFKSIFKFFAQLIPSNHLPNLGEYYRIAGALINRYHPLLLMEGADARKAQELLRKAAEPNAVQAFVEVEQLHRRNAQRWVRLDVNLLNDFPILTIAYLKSLTIGIYQIHLSRSYIQDKLQRDGDEEFQVEMLRDENRLPEPGLLRVRIYSRFRNATTYQLWIVYTPNNDQERDDGMEINDVPPIQGYYCTCKSGARTVGSCAHIASILWYLGFARHENNIRYPPIELIAAIKDAGNRPQARNP